MFFIGRSDWSRTSGLLNPIQARYHLRYTPICTFLFGKGDDWRRRWDSNPRALADYLISSQGRYDHFDTSP